MAFRTTWHPFRKRRPGHGGMPIASFLVGYGPGKTCRCTILTYIIYVYMYIYIYIPNMEVSQNGGTPKTSGFTKWSSMTTGSPSTTVPITVLSLAHRNAAIPASVHCDLGQHHVDSWTLAKQFKNGILNMGI